MEQRASHPFVNGVLVGWHAGADVRRGCPVVIIVVIIPIVFLYGFLREIFIQVVPSLSSLQRKEQQWVRNSLPAGQNGILTCCYIEGVILKKKKKIDNFDNNRDKGKTWGKVKFWIFF